MSPFVKLDPSDPADAVKILRSCVDPLGDLADSHRAGRALETLERHVADGAERARVLEESAVHGSYVDADIALAGLAAVVPVDSAQLPEDQPHLVALAAVTRVVHAARAYVRGQTDGRWEALLIALGEDHEVGPPPGARHVPTRRRPLS